MSDSPTTTIHDVIAGIGLSAPVTNAEWGELFADALLETGDMDAIRYALADAGEGYRSKHLSMARSRARSTVSAAIRQRGDNGTADEAMHQQLGFEVCFEGFAPTPLVNVTHEVLIEAERYMMRQYQGLEKNLAFIRHARRVTAPFPGQRIGDLIVSGLLDPDAFVVEPAA